MSSVKVHNLKDKIHEDNRGWVANLAEYATEQKYKIENIHLASIRPGEIRGNHFHKKQKEWILVFGGKGIFSWKEQGKIRKQEIESGSQFLFEVLFSIPPVFVSLVLTFFDLNCCCLVGIALDLDQEF